MSSAISARARSSAKFLRDQSRRVIDGDLVWSGASGLSASDAAEIGSRVAIVRAAKLLKWARCGEDFLTPDELDAALPTDGVEVEA